MNKKITGVTLALIMTTSNCGFAHNTNYEDIIQSYNIIKSHQVSKPNITYINTPLTKWVTNGEREVTYKIAFHYTGKSNVKAISTINNWFLPIAQGKHPKTFASAHYILEHDGSIYNMIPLNCVAYTTNEANSYSIGVECATVGKDNHYTDKEYISMVKLGAWLCQYYSLDPRKDFIRHYDVTRKVCPIFFVENEEEWEQFKIDCYYYMIGKTSDDTILNHFNRKARGYY